jgi:3-methyladenine DNA glycosylase AlkD
MDGLLERLENLFEAARNPTRAQGTAKYMRNQFVYYGISAHTLRSIAREALEDRSAPDEAGLREVALACWERDEREWQYFACSYIRRHVRHASPAFLATAEQLITTKSWWDTVDTLAAHTVGPLVAANPELTATIDDWIDSDDFWGARSAILHQLTYKDDTDADKLFDYCLRRSADKEFFIRKAIGWALREYSKTDPCAVAGFVLRNDERLSGLSKREALKRIERGKVSPRARN